MTNTKTTETTGAGEKVGYFEIAMASSSAVAGPVLLHAMWTGDLRYLPNPGWLELAAAWSFGLVLSGFTLVTAYRLWRQTGPQSQARR